MPFYRVYDEKAYLGDARDHLPKGLNNFFVIRHGETDHNAKGLAQGQIDTELNEKGREQATAAQAIVGALGLGEHDAVSDDACEADLLVVLVDAERDRAVDGSLKNLSGDVSRPVGFLGHELENVVDIQSSAVRAQCIWTARVRINLCLVGEHSFSVAAKVGGFRLQVAACTISAG